MCDLSAAEEAEEAHLGTKRTFIKTGYEVLCGHHNFFNSCANF